MARGTVLVTYSGLPLICTVCVKLRIVPKVTVDRDRDHHHHTVVAFASTTQKRSIGCVALSSDEALTRCDKYVDL